MPITVTGANSICDGPCDNGLRETTSEQAATSLPYRQRNALLAAATQEASRAGTGSGLTAQRNMQRYMEPVK